MNFAPFRRNNSGFTRKKRWRYCNMTIIWKSRSSQEIGYVKIWCTSFVSSLDLGCKFKGLKSRSRLQSYYVPTLLRQGFFWWGRGRGRFWERCGRRWLQWKKPLCYYDINATGLIENVRQKMQREKMHKRTNVDVFKKAAHSGNQKSPLASIARKLTQWSKRGARCVKTSGKR